MFIALLAGAELLLAAQPSEAQRLEFKRPETIPFPADNPYTPQKAALGKMLFFETRLSRDKNINCASCHNPSFGWEVPFALAIGAGGEPLSRHSPTTINLAWSENLFWDGRAPTLEAQARGPIEAEVEMDLPLPVAVRRLKEVKGYVDGFNAVFPEEGLNETTLLKAIATYERTIVTGDTPFDRWLRGEGEAMSSSAQRGFELFTGKANCSACHSGWNFTDDKFHDIGVPTLDEGRIAITGEPSDRHAFKTPSLRETAARAPYMHQGQVTTLEAVMLHYITGGVARPSRSPLLQPVAMSADDIHDLVAFMRALSSPAETQVLPHLPAL